MNFMCFFCLMVFYLNDCAFLLKKKTKINSKNKISWSLTINKYWIKLIYKRNVFSLFLKEIKKKKKMLPFVTTNNSIYRIFEVFCKYLKKMPYTQYKGRIARVDTLNNVIYRWSHAHTQFHRNWIWGVALYIISESINITVFKKTYSHSSSD